MTRPQQWSAAILGLGIVVGTIADAIPERVVPRAGGYWIVSGDFHVHAGPGDGTLLPWELRRETRRAGIDVIAVTNHNSLYAARIVEWWARRFPGDPLMIKGEEITNPAYHLAAVGLETTVSGGQSAASAIEAVHAQGGVAIAAHPSREYWQGYDERALALLDGAEAVNSTETIALRDYAEFRQRAAAHNPDLAPIGSTDFHGWPKLIGAVRTYLFVREQTKDGVLDAIRSGRTVALDHRGTLYGRPELVRLVEANRPAGRSDANAGWRRFAVACGWLGLVGLVFFGRSTA